jgi:hypothetical protein
MRIEELLYKANDARAGRHLLALATIAYGISCFLQRDFPIYWQPFPESMPLRQPLAFLSAGLLVLSGVGTLLPPNYSFCCIDPGRPLFPLYRLLAVAVL